MRRVMLYFGSFNPVHVGHLAIANWALATGEAQELWFVVSPQNPFKENDTLAPEGDRLRMVETAIDSAGLGDVMRACDVEFSLPRPSFTIDTLDRLQTEYPDCRFSILMGGDNFRSIKKWRDYRRIVENYPMTVYARGGEDCRELSREFPQVAMPQGAPLFDISSTMLRDLLKKGARIPALLPGGVYDYIVKNDLYV